YAYDSDARTLAAAAHRFDPGGHPVVHVGLDLPTKTNKGNSVGRTLDDTINQVLRAAGGLAELIPDLPRYRDKPTIIVPTVVTTAEIDWYPTPLGNADLSTGSLPDGIVRTVPWLWYSANVSKSMSPRARRLPVSSGDVDPMRRMLLHQ